MAASRQSASATPTKRFFTVDEYDRMAEAGIFAEDDRVELIEGEVIQMSPPGNRHCACVNRLNMLLVRNAGTTAIISVQNPVRLDDYSQPQPDLVLLRARSDFYATRRPGPSDTLLMIEVADTSVTYDRNVKASLYAKAGVPEFWLVDLPADRIEVYADPVARRYHARQAAVRGDSIALRNLPGVSLAVDDVLG